MGDHSDTDDNGDGEGVWSPDIEQCFREALLLFPPCGRRKHILQEEGGGKMYGRNELIARHIRMRTGKIRSRKQVSSHIQVLARRKAKADSAMNGSNTDLTASSSSPSGFAQVNLSLSDLRNQQRGPTTNGICDIWTDRPIVTTKIRLVEFSAFIEHRRLTQHLIGEPTKLSTLEPINDLVLNRPQQGVGDPMNRGSMQHGLLMPAYGLDRPITPTTASNLSQQQLTSTHQLTQSSLQMAAPSSDSPYQTLQQGHSQLQQPLINNQQHHQQMNQLNTEASNMLMSTCSSPAITNYQLQAAAATSGFTRHSYVKIDYRAPVYRQPNKLERIDIDQIQDKFPEIGGSEGLYQRGPSDAFFLIKFWADINSDFEYNVEDQNSFFGFSCHFETIEPLKSITCSTKACSYGLQVVEKVEKIFGAFNSSNGRYSFDIDRSPMCEFMTRFIKKLRQLPRASQMNSVLENFTVLQVVTSESTSEILLCLAFVFEIATSAQNNGSQHHVYKLTKN